MIAVAKWASALITWGAIIAVLAGLATYRVRIMQKQGFHFAHIPEFGGPPQSDGVTVQGRVAFGLVWTPTIPTLDRMTISSDRATFDRSMRARIVVRRSAVTNVRRISSPTRSGVFFESKADQYDGFAFFPMRTAKGDLLDVFRDLGWPVETPAALPST